MFRKVVLLLVLVAVAVQSYVPYEVKKPTEDDGDRLIADLKKLIEQASKTTQESLKNLHTYLVVQYSQSQEKVQSKILAPLKDISERISKLHEEAKNLNLDTKECSREDEMIYVVKFHKKVEACTGDIVNKPKTLEVQVKKIEDESADIVKKLTADFEACRKDTENAKCKNKVAVEVARAMAELPAKIRETADEALPAILNSLPAAEKCVMDAADVLIPEELEIANSTESCLKNKIHPQKQH